MRSKAILATTLFFAMLAAHASGDAPHWEYAGKNSPAKWGQLEPGFALCGLGKEQSPIDIRNAAKSPLAPLDFGYTGSGAEIVNNGRTNQEGHTVTVS